MRDVLLFVIAAFAVWRAALLVTEDEGPFGLIAYLRDRIDPHQKKWYGRGIRCVWCVSWWAGAATAAWLCYWGWLDVTLTPLWWFGLSGSAIAINQWATTPRRR